VFRGGHVVEDLGILAVKIMNQMAEGYLTLLKLPDTLPGLLSNPGAVRISGHTGYIVPTSTELDEEEGVQCLHEQGFNRQEVAGQDLAM